MSHEPTDDFAPGRDRGADAAVVPVIDTAPFRFGDPAAQRTAVAAVGHGCVGFFVTAGHGVPDARRDSPWR